MKGNRIRRNYSAKTHTPFTLVYLLPCEDYVGITNNLVERLRNHISKGRIVEGCRVLASLESREEARELEGLLHVMGYLGNSMKGVKKRKKIIIKNN